MKMEKSHLKILNELYIIETNGAGGGGASIPRKVLTCRKSGQNPWKSGKNGAQNPCKNGDQSCLTSKNGAQS